ARLGGEPVELEVHLHAIPEPAERGHEAVIAGDSDAVRVQDDPGDRTLGRRLDDLEQLWMHRRLATREHQDVDLAALSLDRGVQRSEDVRQPSEAADARRRGGKAGWALEVAALGDVEQQHAGVLRLQIAEAVQVTHRNWPDVVRNVRNDLPSGRSPLLE